MTASPISGSPPPLDALRAKHDAAVEHANWMRDHLTARDMDGISAVNLGWRLHETLDREAALLARVDDLERERNMRERNEMNFGNADAQALMGHASPTTTSVYLRKLSKEKQMERVRDLSWGVTVGV